MYYQPHYPCVKHAEQACIVLEQQLAKMIKVIKLILTLLEEAKHTRVFTETMFIGSFVHTRAPRIFFFLSQIPNMFFEYGQSLCQS